MISPQRAQAVRDLTSHSGWQEFVDRVVAARDGEVSRLPDRVRENDNPLYFAGVVGGLRQVLTVAEHMFREAEDATRSGDK